MQLHISQVHPTICWFNITIFDASGLQGKYKVSQIPTIQIHVISQINKDYKVLSHYMRIACVYDSHIKVYICNSKSPLAISTKISAGVR